MATSKFAYMYSLIFKRLTSQKTMSGKQQLNYSAKGTAIRDSADRNGFPYLSTAHCRCSNFSLALSFASSDTRGLWMVAFKPRALQIACRLVIQVAHRAGKEIGRGS